MLQMQLDSRNTELLEVTSKELNELHLQGKLEEVNTVSHNNTIKLLFLFSPYTLYIIHITTYLSLFTFHHNPFCRYILIKVKATLRLRRNVLVF